MDLVAEGVSGIALLEHPSVPLLPAGVAGRGYRNPHTSCVLRQVEGQVSVRRLLVLLGLVVWPYVPDE